MSRFYNNLKTTLLLALLSGVMIWAGSMFGTAGVVIALVLAVVTNVISYFYSARIATMAMGAHEVGPDHELHQIVQGLTRRAGLPMPRVYVAPHDAPNAFAAGRSPKHAVVCATDGLMRMLSRQEVAAVMAHELAHVKHRDILIQSVAATIGAAISSLGYLFMFGGAHDDDGEGANPFGALLAIIVAPIAAGLIQFAISRSREFAADTGAAEITNDPMALATALEKIHLASQRIPLEVNPAFNSLFIAEPRSAIRRIGNLFSTHPPVEQRIQNLIGRETTGQFRYAA